VGGVAKLAQLVNALGSRTSVWAILCRLHLN